MVRTLACHARGRGFEPHPGRQFAVIAQSVERILGKDEVGGSNPPSSSKKSLNAKGVGRFFVFIKSYDFISNVLYIHHTLDFEHFVQYNVNIKIYNYKFYITEDEI